MRWLSWLSYLFLDTLPAGEPPHRPLVAALDAAVVSALQRQTGAGGWQCQHADPGLNRHGNSITLWWWSLQRRAGKLLLLRLKQKGGSGCACRAFTRGH